MSTIEKLFSENILSDEDTTRRARLFVQITLIFSIIGILYGTLYWVSLDFIEGTQFLYLMTVINSLGILLFYKTQNLVIAGNYLGLMLFSAFVFLSYTSGGLFASANSWFGILVLVTLLIAGVRTGVFWGLIAFAYLVTLLVMTQNGFEFPSMYAEGTDAPRQLIGFGGGVLLISILAVIFESNKKRAYEKLDHALNTTVKDLENAREHVYQSASETASKASECADYSEGVRANLENISSAIEQLKGNFDQIATRAQSSSQTVYTALSLSKNSQGRVESLLKSSEEIGKIVGIIRSITLQVNLLALNAGVEAVRAGQAGGSFSVVADEIKNLATKTSESTDTIEQTVQMIQKEISVFVDDMEQLGKIMVQVSENQSEISSSVEQQSSGTSMMADSIRKSTSQGRQIVSLLRDLQEKSDALKYEATGE